MTTAILLTEQGKPAMAADKPRAVRELLETLAALLISPSSENEKLSTMLEMNKHLCAVARGFKEEEAGTINRTMACIAKRDEVISLHAFDNARSIRALSRS